MNHTVKYQDETSNEPECLKIRQNILRNKKLK